MKMNSVAVAAQDGWAKWLNELPWDMYHTLTFKDRTAPEQAEKEFHRYVRRINERLYGKRYRKKGTAINWARALEYQKRGVIHFHCLTNGTMPVKYSDLRHLWNTVSDNTGFSYIEKYDPGKGATAYLSKYVVKDGDIDVFINKEHVRCDNTLQLGIDI